MFFEIMFILVILIFISSFLSLYVKIKNDNIPYTYKKNHYICIENKLELHSYLKFIDDYVFKKNWEDLDIREILNLDSESRKWLKYVFISKYLIYIEDKNYYIASRDLKIIPLYGTDQIHITVPKHIKFLGGNHGHNKITFEKCKNCILKIFYDQSYGNHKCSKFNNIELKIWNIFLRKINLKVDRTYLFPLSQLININEEILLLITDKLKTFN